MKNTSILTFLIWAVGIFNGVAQEQFNIIEGPTQFMRLNNEGTDFTTVDLATETGYTFYHSYLDAECPWSTVSEEGTNIYTKLNLGVVSDYKDIFMLTPKVSLSTNEMYKFSQAVVGIANETVVPAAITKLEVKLVKGDPADFTVSKLDELTSLVVYICQPDKSGTLFVDNITVETSGAYYFVVYVSYFGIITGNTTGMSVGFTQNFISNNDYTSTLNVEENSFKIYPNPGNGMIRVKDYTGSLKVKNVLGKTVFQTENYQGEVLNLSHLPNGIYLLGNQEEYHQFIKQ